MTGDQETWAIAPMQRTSTVEHALAVLRQAIVDGGLPAGAQLREARLAAALRVGRGVIREAISHLVQEGLAHHELNRGAFVRMLTPADGVDLYFAREAVEVAAVQRVIETEGADFSRLNAALENMRQKATDGGKPSESLIEADVQFHREVVDLAGSARLSRSYSTLAAETQMLLRSHPPYPLDAYVAEHEALYEAIRLRDRNAPNLIAEHLRLSARLVAQGIAAAQEVQAAQKTSSSHHETQIEERAAS